MASITNSSAENIPALVDCLCAGFRDDPVVNWFVRQDEHNEAALNEFFRLAVARLTMPFGQVYHAPDFRGVALWAPPGKWNLGVWAQIQLLPAMLRISGIKALPRILGGLHALEDAHLKEPHMYLSFLCTVPEARGQGVGSSLMRPMLDYCDDKQLPIYLENTKEQNEPFYRRFGFVPTGHVDLGPACPAYYETMVRSPEAR